MGLDTTAAHTGDSCIPYAGHLSTENMSVQGNMLRSAEVWPAMREAFDCTAGTPAQYEFALDDVPLATALMAEGDAVKVPLPPGIVLRITGPDGTTASAELPAEAPIVLAIGEARFVALRA